MKTIRLLAFLALLGMWLAIPHEAGAQTTTTAAPTTTLAPTTTTTVTTTTVTTTTVTTTTVTTTTVTTTTVTTTTTLIPDNLVTNCTITSDQPLGSGKYHVSGHFTGAVASTVGMAFAIPNTLKAAGRCLCNSFARQPLTVIVGPSDPGVSIIAYHAATLRLVGATGDQSAETYPFFAVCQ